MKLALFFSYMLVAVVFLGPQTACTENPSHSEADIIPADTFLVHRRQSLIGQEIYRVDSGKDSIIVRSTQGENERGRISGVVATLRLSKEFSPLSYESWTVSAEDTANILSVRVNNREVRIKEQYMDTVSFPATTFFPLHSSMPAAIEMMLYHYYFRNDKPVAIATLPRGEVSIIHRKRDTVQVKGKETLLDRYIVKGINWGYRTIWLDASKNLVAVVQANTQFRELIRKGYEELLPHFIAGHVDEQMSALSDYTRDLKREDARVTAYIGANVIDGVHPDIQKDMTLIVEDGLISVIGPGNETQIPEGARVIDVTGKTLMPGLWDMHAHANQVQWAPAYLAGGITTIRDVGNEMEFATAFRDAIAMRGAMGPDILLGGMVDGDGITGNGVIRARTPEEAIAVVAFYHERGYKQIKIYNAVEPNIVEVLCREAHAKGMTVTGHVPRSVENAVAAVELGMDQLNHRSRFLSALLPDKKLSELGNFFVHRSGITSAQVKRTTDLFLKHKTVLDPTISLDIVRALPKGTPVEEVEPDAHRIAYELFEGKRFREGVSPAQSERAWKEIRKSMEIIGDLFRAGVPIVAGTDNAIPVFSLYLEIEAYHVYGKLTPLEAIQTATIIPARVMGMADVTGTLEQGKQADIAILDKNPLEDIAHIRTVSAVVSNGNYFKSDPLWLAADFKTRN